MVIAADWPFIFNISQEDLGYHEVTATLCNLSSNDGEPGDDGFSDNSDLDNDSTNNGVVSMSCSDRDLDIFATPTATTGSTAAVLHSLMETAVTAFDA